MKPLLGLKVKQSALMKTNKEQDQSKTRVTLARASDYLPLALLYR